ncbi:VIR protein [Plasmodium vivax]|uniref:VIR protein n=1 Tax=Plasmodium vivax TaxID=5855 RepID=A0A1G4EBH2_PLAVI|nr:VIR protein [Plasmodium vivax]
MSMGWSTRHRNLIGMYQQLTGGGCTNNFVNFKNETEREIAELNKKQPGEFCQKCSKLRKTIITKDAEFKKCYTESSKQLKLIENSAEIKGFIDECTAYHQCIQNRSSRRSKHDALKRESEKCLGNQRCEQKTAATVSQKAKPPSRLASETSSTRTPQRQRPQIQTGNHADRGGSDKQNAVLQPQHVVKSPTSSFEPKGEVSESVTDHPSSALAQVETLPKLSSSSPSKDDKLGPPPSDKESRNIATEDADPGNTLHVGDSHERSVQHNLSDGQDSSGNTQVDLASSGTLIENQAHDGQPDTKETSVSSPHTETSLVSGEGSNGYPIVSAIAGGNKEKVAANGVHTVNVGINDSSAGDLTTRGQISSNMPSSGRSTEVRTSDSNDSSHVSTGSEATPSMEGDYGVSRSGSDHNQAGVNGDVDEETRCSEGVSLPHDSATTCTATKNTEITVDNNILATLSNIFGVIKDNKENVINTSIPMGIVLLLGLLFKVN